MYITTLFFLLIEISCVSIPYIDHVYLQPLSTTNSNVRAESSRSCDECLCENFLLNQTNVALNCFLNGTCQFFETFPFTYKLQPSNKSRLYFLKNQFPNASKCCMPNITELVDLLKTAVPVVMNLTFRPGVFGYDEARPSEVAVSGSSPHMLYWFDLTLMTHIRNFSVPASSFLTVYNNQTFTSNESIPLVHIRDSETNYYLGNINYSSLKQIRKFSFLNNGQRVIVTSPLNYTVQEFIPFPALSPHGAAKVNDTYIYASSWGSNSIYSYKYENSTWTQNLFVSNTSTASGSFLSVADCGRVWFVNTQFGLRIYDSSGVSIAKWDMNLKSSKTLYDLLCLPNSVFLISHNNPNKIVRYGLQVKCS